MNYEPDKPHTPTGLSEKDLDARLTAALARIPAVAVPSNFTARVLQAVELEELRAGRAAAGWTLNWRFLWPRVAGLAAILLVAGVGIQRYETSAHRAAVAQTLALVAQAQALPNVDALENLDAIQRISQSAHADGELLAVLQ